MLCAYCRYEVNFQDGIDCGGAYIKLLSDIGDLSLVGPHSTSPCLNFVLNCLNPTSVHQIPYVHIMYSYFTFATVLLASAGVGVGNNHSNFVLDSGRNYTYI